MKTLKFTFDENHNPVIEGNFEFEVGETISVSDDFTPIKRISFAWSPEMQQDMQAFNNDKYSDMYETIGERIKQDFIKLLKT